MSCFELKKIVCHNNYCTNIFQISKIVDFPHFREEDVEEERIVQTVPYFRTFHESERAKALKLETICAVVQPPKYKIERVLHAEDKHGLVTHHHTHHICRISDESTLRQVAVYHPATDGLIHSHLDICHTEEIGTAQTLVAKGFAPDDMCSVGWHQFLARIWHCYNTKANFLKEIASWADVVDDAKPSVFERGRGINAYVCHWYDVRREDPEIGLITPCGNNWKSVTTTADLHCPDLIWEVMHHRVHKHRFIKVARVKTSVEDCLMLYEICVVFPFDVSNLVLFSRISDEVAPTRVVHSGPNGFDVYSPFDFGRNTPESEESH